MKNRLRFAVVGALFLAAGLAGFGPAIRAADDAPATVPGAVKTKVAVFHLSEALTERPAGFSLSSILSSGSGKGTALSQMIVSLNKAAKDPAIGGVFFDLQSFSISLSQAEELGQLMQRLRAAKKRVIVYASDFDTGTYALASHADTVIMPDQGNILMPGVQIGLMFWAGLFEKIHVQADMVQVGKFKGAAEPYTRTEASPEFKKEIDTLVDGMYGHLVSLVADNRKLTADEVKTAIDEGWLTGKRAQKLGLVDKLMNRDKVDAWLGASFENGADLVENYGQPKTKSLDLSSPLAIFDLLGSDKKTTRTNQPAIAVIYADGEIMPDSPSETSDEYVTPGRMRKALDAALADSLVKAIVLRVDSPGGSASASDEIWQMLKEADKKKPVTVSMGRLAASGGYYISCAGRSITAEKSTITGSIGVVGGKIVLKGLADLAGINIQTISKGKHAGIFDAMQPFSAEERTFVEALMGETYDLFKSRVHDGRGDKIKNIDDVAQGRLFTGDHALEVGLVDGIGSLNDTVVAAAKVAGIEKNYQIIVYPETKTLNDILREGLTMDASMPLDVRAGLEAIPAQYRREAIKTLRLMSTLRDQKVMVAFPAGLILDGK